MKIKNRAFSLVEILVVIAIIAIMAAISYPVFLRVKWNSYKTVCISNFHQIGLNMNMYRAEWGDATVGKASELGLPQRGNVLTEPLSCHLSAVGIKGGILCEDASGYLYYLPIFGSQADDQFEPITKKYQGNTVIFADFNHNNPEGFGKAFYPNFGIGLNLDGHVVTKNSNGVNIQFPYPDWWNPL